jgi:mannose-6-phosphate isomerase-like protein (cupin superfamily)
MAAAIDLNERLATFDQHWSPRTVATFNGHDIMVVKVDDPFTWHRHDDTGDFFLVLKGKLDIELRDHTVTIKQGDLLIEPTGTQNSGNAATAAPRIKI